MHRHSLSVDSPPPDQGASSLSGPGANTIADGSVPPQICSWPRHRPRAAVAVRGTAREDAILHGCERPVNSRSDKQRVEPTRPGAYGQSQSSGHLSFPLMASIGLETAVLVDVRLARFPGRRSIDSSLHYAATVETAVQDGGQLATRSRGLIDAQPISQAAISRRRRGNVGP